MVNAFLLSKLFLCKTQPYFFYEGFNVQIMIILAKRTWVVSYIKKQFRYKKSVNHFI